MQRLRFHLSHFLPNLSVVRTPSLRPYVGLITFSAASLAIGLGCLLRNHLTFTWHDTTGVIGWMSVHQYPKQQEFFYYLLALIGVPAVICLYWLGWQVYSRWAAKLTAQPFHHVLKANALASIPLWLCWLQLPHIDEAGVTGFLLPLGFSLFIKAGLLYNRFLPSLQNARDSDDSDDSVDIAGENARSRLLHIIHRCVASVLMPVFIYLLMYSGDIHGKLDLFHEGERLAPLNEMLRGGIPFRDIYVQHGLFQNAYLAGVGSWIFEPTLMGVRSMERVLAPLGYVALYLLGLQVFRMRWFTAFICVLIAAGTEFSVSARHSLGLLSFAIIANFLTHFYRGELQGLMQGFLSRRELPVRTRLLHWTRYAITFGWKLSLAGFCTSLAFWYSTEIGLYSLGGIGLFLLLFSLQSGKPMPFRPMPLTTYTCGILLGFLPVSLYFLWHGALDDMFWNTYIQCRYQIATWGLAFPSLSDTLAVLTKEGWQAFILSEGFRWYLPIGVFGVVSGHLTYRCLCSKLWTSEGATKLLLLLLGGIAFFRTALGRADGGHLHYGSTFLWLLCLLPLERGFLGMIRSLFTNLPRRAKNAAKNAPDTVGRGPVPRHAEDTPIPRHAESASDTVGRGPVPRHAENAPDTVGRGPVPRHATIAGDRPPRYGRRRLSRHATIAGDRPPRYGMQGRRRFNVGRGKPVPRHAKNAPDTVGRGPVPRHAAIAGDRPPRYGRRRLPRHAAIAGDRPPRYGIQGRLHFNVGRGPVPRHAAIAGDRPPRYGMQGRRRRAEAFLKTTWILIPIILFSWYVNEVHQPLAGFQEKWHRLRQNPFSRRVASEELTRVGRVDIPDEQAAQIQKVVAYIHEHTAPNEKIFDFTSQGAYYFFANRPSVTRFHQVSYASTPAMQREVVAALTRDKTRLVLFKTGGWFDAVDGIPVEERHPIIAKYLHENYTFAVDINGTHILLRAAGL